MRILLMEDDDSTRDFLGDFLRRLGHTVEEAADGQQGWNVFINSQFHLVLSDILMPGASGLDFLNRMKGEAQDQNADVVLFTANAGIKTAVEAMRAGAYDYLIKPIDVAELVAVLEKVEEHQALKLQNTVLTHHFQESIAEATEETRRELEKWKNAYEKVSGTGHSIVVSPVMQRLYEQARHLQRDPSISILIEGETGTGKEILARYIHYGDRANPAPFIDINCAALAAGLFENELFGYEAGTFTGGLPKGQKGKLDMAAGGTIFLDEIAEIPVELQAKLLQVLQNHEFYRVGGLRKQRLQARIIAATNVDINQSIESGTFRQDLYYRLSTAHLYIPPLRERPEDILPLAHHFLAYFAKDKGRHFTGFSGAAEQKLLEYEWPGNVRELRNSIESAVLLNEGPVLEASHLSLGRRNRVPRTAIDHAPAILLNPEMSFNLP